MDTLTIETLFADIEAHEAECAESEENFVQRCADLFEEEGTLDSDQIQRLYEILDALDYRAGYVDEYADEVSEWD